MDLLASVTESLYAGSLLLVHKQKYSVAFIPMDNVISFYLTELFHRQLQV